MKKFLFAAILVISSNVFAHADSWIKQARFLIPAETLVQVDKVVSDDGDLTVKVISLDRADGLYDVVLTTGSIESHQTFVSSGHSSVAGDYSLKKNKDGSYQLHMILGQLNAPDQNVSLKLVLDKEARVIAVE